MNWKKWILFLIVFSSTASYPEEDKNQLPEKNRSPVSDDLAHVLWHVMKNYDGEYDFRELISTLNKLNERKIQGKPLDECYSSLLEALEKRASEKADLNLQMANSFLQKLETTPGVNEVIKHKLYYKVIKPGKGESISNFIHSPLISFKEKTLNGEILSEYSSGIRIPLSETISGLQKGLVGIKIGEKREIFIHPDFAYGDFPKPEPYSLVMIEVTLISL
jgi:peptidylprolyl isomerase